VVILCKTPGKAEKAVEDILRQASALSNPQTPTRVSYEQVDLADLKSIEQVSSKLKEKLQKIDVLVGSMDVSLSGLLDKC
jgi:short-subunit dehydrogenase